MKVTPQTVTRLAFFGLSVVLVMLAALSIWAVTGTQGLANDVTQSVRSSDALQQARYAMSEEAAAEHAYLSGDRSRFRTRFIRAVAIVDRNLHAAASLDPAQRSTLESALAIQHAYETGFASLIDSAEAGRIAQARRLETTHLDPLFGRIERIVDSRAQHEESASMTNVDALHNTGAAVQAATIAAVFLGLLLFGLFGYLFRVIRRRLQSENAELQRTEGRLNILVEQLPVAAYMGPLDPTASTLYISPEIESMMGYSANEWTDDVDFWPSVLHPDDKERVLALHARHMSTHERFTCEYRMMKRDGSPVWVRDEAVVAPDGPGGPLMQLGVMVNITERRKAEEALEHQALHDGLTDLPNRTLLFDRVEQAILAAKRERKPLALLLMDLDRFKEVNDTFGHHYGDLLLQQVGNRLRTVLRESDTVARLGGDEFALLLPSVDHVGAVATVQKLLYVLRQPYRVEGHMLDVGASIGLAHYPIHGDSVNILMQRADVAMYSAKRTDGGYAVYEPGDDPYSPSRLALISELRHAIDNNLLSLQYQPKERFKDDGTARVEALVRWEHAERGAIGPDEFIPLAEHAGLIKSLTLWVLNASLCQCREWRENGSIISVAVNLSARTLHDPDLVTTITGILENWGAEPSWLEIEVTEGALMIDPAGALGTLTQLHDMGISIAIDDFGTGYSSLGYLKRLPADHIKIDKSFVMEMAENDDNAFIVRSVIDLGHNLDLEVVAEGVEDLETWDLLADMKCDVAQGYYLSRPISPDDVPRWFRRRVLKLVDEAS